MNYIEQAIKQLTRIADALEKRNEEVAVNISYDRVDYRSIEEEWTEEEDKEFKHRMESFLRDSQENKRVKDRERTLAIADAAIQAAKERIK